MSTRGLFGFRSNGIDKAVYNHSDSYPEWLGNNFVGFLIHNSENIPEIFSQIETVDVNEKPTEEQKKLYKSMGWFNKSVSNRNDDDWYCLLYGIQDLTNWQKAIDKNIPIYIENSIGFIKRSLHCEYAYIYDLDAESLEFYVGFQKAPDENNRYGQKDDDGYYPCRLIHVFPMEEMKKEGPDQITEKMVNCQRLGY